MGTPKLIQDAEVRKCSFLGILVVQGGKIIRHSPGTVETISPQTALVGFGRYMRRHAQRRGQRKQFGHGHVGSPSVGPPFI
jgi:hypothetical protein